MASYRYVVADVFTGVPLTGNQLAVFTDARELPEELLQPLAREMNFSETVFVYPSEGDGHVRIRIFTPATELPFAGHPVLGTAFVLGGPLQLGEIRLETGAGTVPVELEREGARIVFGRMSQPMPAWRPFEREAELLAALGVERSELPVELYDLGPTFVYVALPDEAAVAALRPDLKALAAARAGKRTASPARARAGRRGCSRRTTASTRIPRPARPPARWRCTSRGTGGSPSATRSRSRRVRRSAARRRSSRVPRATGDRIDAVYVGGSAVIVARGEFRL